MRYYKQISDNYILSIGTGYGGEEITEEEYNALLAEIRQKAEFVERLYSGEITANDVPQEWRGEIQSRLEERTAADLAAQDEEATAEDIANALEAIL